MLTPPMELDPSPNPWQVPILLAVEVAEDFYRALYELYHDRGCFSNQYFAIPGSSPLVIFGESYGGKYAPAIAQKIIEAK